MGKEIIGLVIYLTFFTAILFSPIFITGNPYLGLTLFLILLNAYLWDYLIAE